MGRVRAGSGGGGAGAASQVWFTVGQDRVESENPERPGERGKGTTVESSKLKLLYEPLRKNSTDFLTCSGLFLHLEITEHSPSQLPPAGIPKQSGIFAGILRAQPCSFVHSSFSPIAPATKTIGVVGSSGTSRPCFRSSSGMNAAGWPTSCSSSPRGMQRRLSFWMNRSCVTMPMVSLL